MALYLLKLLVLTVFSFTVIFFYYFGFPVHQENFNGYISYIIIIGVIYAIVKYFQVSGGEKKVIYTPFKILMYFLLHLFVLSILFFSLNGDPLGNGLILFFKIVLYSVLPVSIIFITTSFGNKALSYIKSFKEESSTFRFLLSLGVGFFSFVFLLTIFGLLGFYNSVAVSIILIGFIIFSYKELGDSYNALFDTHFSFNNHHLESGNIIKKLSLRLLTTEWFFIIATLIISVSLINIIRPFPIGWDDLGAYMNWPHLLASAGELGFLGAMYSWQTFTGIGFLFGGSTQAFFLNNVGGILSLIVITLIVSEFLKTSKKTFINIPLLVATIFISMPMVVFQQAKDMKLDSGLFFISVIAIYLFYYLYHKPKSEILLKDKRERLIYFVIIGLLAGFAFSIKFTSLILISAIIGILFYVRLGVLGFLGYLAIYFAIFTGGGLWSYMNVVFPNTTDFKQTFMVISGLIGVGLLGVASYNKLENAKVLFTKVIALILGVLVALLPWISKNLHQADDISVGSIIGGQQERFIADYTKIYSEEDLEEIKNEQGKSRGLTSSGTTMNEDFGRYFGYEEGINNYLKLPWNLTMQKNQGGEFTGITFLFLALLPALLLFLPYRKDYYKLAIVFALLFELALFLFLPTSNFLTAKLAEFNLPLGYIVILGFFLSWLILNFMLKKSSSLVNLFKINLVLTLFYTFLWAISAFGIVWYGITMYFGFLMMIAIGAYYMTSYNKETDSKELFVKLFGSVVLLVIVSVHFFFSVYPHTFNNLKSAGYVNYKTGKITEAEGIFLYHPEYLVMLFEMNIKDDKKTDFILSNIESSEIKNILTSNKLESNIKSVEAVLKQLQTAESVDIKTKKAAKRSLLSIYETVSNPSEEYKSEVIIYRLGTFLKYFITENHKRLFNDDLITQFDTYIYDKNVDTTVDNMKKLGLSYLLTDLNAATIDKDPRHDLTRRYENLLETFTSDKLELVDTDSVCLKIALEDYRKSDKGEGAISDYMILGGVNFEKYYDDGKVINRNQKLVTCYKYIYSLVKGGEVNKNNYNYLLSFKNYLDKNNIVGEDNVYPIMNKFFTHGYKALFKIK